MRRTVRWLLALVIGVDLAVAAVFLGASYVPSLAGPADPAGPAGAPAEESGEDIPDASAAESLRLLGEELARVRRELELREAEASELLRGAEVLRRAGIELEPKETEPEPDDYPVAEPDPSFLRLQRAYENMEPDTAARALARLAERDRDAVVELLLGWKPRTSGAILDAITLIDAGLAADLSYEIWRLSGKTAPHAATERREEPSVES